MRKTIVLMAVLTPVASLSAQEPRPVLTLAELRAVNVYRHSAELLSHASCAVSAGVTDIVIRNVSSEMYVETLQVGVSNPAVTVLGSEFLQDYYTHYEGELDEAQEGGVYQRVEQLQLRLRAKKHQRTGVQKALEVLDKNQPLPAHQPGMNAGGLAFHVDYIRKRYPELLDQMAELTSEMERLEQEIEGLKHGDVSARQGKGEKASMRHAVRVRVLCEQPAKLSLQLRYVAGEAGWTPQYEVKGTDLASPLQVTLRASVMQRTGVEWKGVQLTLTNGNPTAHQRVPELTPWFLQVQAPTQPRRAYGGAMQMKEMAFSNTMMEVAEDASSYEQRTLEALEQSNQLSVSYELRTPYSIRSNGAESLITLQRQEVPATFAYHTVPNFQPRAFLVARVGDYAQYGLAGASATVLFDNTYVGRTTLDAGETDTALEITMGVDPRIAIERKEVKDKTSDRFLSTTREKEITYELHIKNNKREAITIGVADRIPLSTNESIKVELVESSHAEYASETGYLHWQLDLDPGQSKVLRISYRVKYPKSMRISNLQAGQGYR